MAKPIPDEIKQQFLAFCRERYEDGGEFSTFCFEPLSGEDEDGDPLWEFHAANYAPDSHDIYELFESVQPEFVIEEHGHDDFVITKPGD